MHFLKQFLKSDITILPQNAKIIIQIVVPALFLMFMFQTILRAVLFVSVHICLSIYEKLHLWDGRLSLK